MKELNHYTSLAEVFRYPNTEQQNSIREWRKTVWNRIPECAGKLELFVSHIHEKPLPVQQEYYIATFDVQALCYLDIGYVLYGEDYNRGVFLANMKMEQQKAGNNCGFEMPDHLPNMLTLLPKLQDESLAEELIFSVMIPAVEKMMEGFGTNANVYNGMLEILLNVMKYDYPESEFEKFSFHSQKKAKSFECFPQCQKIK